MYYDIIPHPMDLWTVKKKLLDGVYFDEYIGTAASPLWRGESHFLGG